MAALVWVDGEWRDDEPKLIGPTDHAFWMATSVFDGARAFRRRAPDLRLHCERLLDSARKFMLEPPLDVERVHALCVEGIRRFPQDAELYIRPMMYAMEGFVTPVAQSTRFTLLIAEMPMPEPKGARVCFSPFRRPARDAAPTDAKAGALYPNMQRALADAKRRGFDNAITSDPAGNIAELATANLWIAKDGVAKTPVCNGTFLNGITRQRVLRLLQAAGLEAIETTLTRRDVEEADEIFQTGNYGKVMPIVGIEDRELQPGPLYERARRLYFDYAEQHVIH